MFKWKSPFFKKKKDAKSSLQEKYQHYSIGRATYGDPEIHSLGERAVFKIGSFCSIASGVNILLGGEHRPDWVTTYPFNVLWKSGNQIKGHPKTKGDVTIGNDVWIGMDAIILSGVTIGDGSVIGLRSIVTKDVPPYSIVAGNPAKVVKKRFSDDIIERLLDIKWWDWEDKRIENALSLLLNTDIEKFVSAVEQHRI